MKRQTLEYEYQLKASVKQQMLEAQMAASEQANSQNQAFIREMQDSQ